ncbi:MAG: aspartyl/glutamyl-tRNA amidotransferase subunit C [Spirochaetales bacterium]|nr:aspartyl/glutamyl-tRNA amidotransferase subunit C [Spirochaetales bacterium]
MVQDDLQATAALAHLDLSEDEVAAALPAFELMLEYFAAMKAADTDVDAFGVSISSLPPTTQPFSIGNRLRSDTNDLYQNNYNNTNNPARINPNTNQNTLSNRANEILERAPESENRFIVIPNVL